jgi:riboflavin synthase
VFTGIIEEVGSIQELRFQTEGGTVTVGAKVVPEGMGVGDSIAVNGVCLTATRIGSDSFQCDVSAETLRRSSFKYAKPGTRVNLERSLMVGGRLGGHFVLGHVDDVGTFGSRTASGDGFEMSFDFPPALERYMVYKGSIAVNGISLTLASVDKGSFSVSVIPHTFQSTNLNQLKIGEWVNLEVDILGKYFERFYSLGRETNENNQSRITADYLKSQGF